MHSKGVAAVVAFHTSENDISKVSCDDGERSNHSLAVTGTSTVNISMPIEKVSSLDVQQSSEIVATENAPSNLTNKISEVSYDFGKGNDISLLVTGSSAINISMPIEKVSPLDVRKASEDETLRERKRKRSCQNCVDESVQLQNSYSVNEEQSEDFTEPLIKCRRLLSIEDSSIPTNSNAEMGLKHPEGNAFEDHISSKHSLALKESCEANINMPTETGPSLDGEMSDHSLTMTGSPVANISVPIAKVSSQDVHESSQAVATEDAGNMSKNEINECSCAICKMSDTWLAVTRSFSNYISMPVDKVSSLDVDESVATKDICNTSENEISDVTFDNDGMSDHLLAMTGSPAANISMPIEKVSTLNAHKSSEAVGAEDTVYICENEISEATFDNCEMSDHSLAVTGSSATNMSMPIENASKLVVHELSEAVELEASGFGENEMNECSCAICKMSDHCLAVSRSFARYISMPIEKVSPQDVHESSKAVAAKQAGNMGENEFSEYSEVSSLEVHESAEARNARQRKRKRNSEKNVDESVRQSADFIEPLSKYRRQSNIEEAAAPAVSKDNLYGNEAVEEKSHQSDSNRVSASSKLPYDVHVNRGEAAVPTVSKDEMCGNEAVEEDKHKADSKHVSASSKLPCDVLVNSEKMEKNALAMCAKIKTEERPVSVGAQASDVDTPHTIGYVRYYLRTAYQFLFGGMRQNPVGSVPLESVIHQPQEPGTAQPSQSTRVRLGRVKRVWNGKAFVPEVQRREQNAPYLRGLRPRRQ
ncbi:uncharacterized protein LOC144663563 isoform X1 [Oculina patagonica]